ncbi:MAG: helix-turn-helix transcriptional regulator, partial [Phycisphaerales bacterium]|nr:helix-turn-helix transcriptional regulator [Phycisphaerales bacterium]
AACCAVDFSVVARHLTTLARAGLVESRKEGRTVWTVARSDALVRRLRDLADAVEEWIRDDDGCGPGCCAAPGSGR